MSSLIKKRKVTMSTRKRKVTMSSTKTILVLHVGGSFEEEPLRYTGGDIAELEVDPDYISYHTLAKFVNYEGYGDVLHFCYVEPGLDISEGLQICFDNVGFVALINHLKHFGNMDVYVQHGVSVPDVVDDVPLLKGSQPHNTSNGVGGVSKEGEEKAFTAGINEAGEGVVNDDAGVNGEMNDDAGVKLGEDRGNGGDHVDVEDWSSDSDVELEGVDSGEDSDEEIREIKEKKREHKAKIKKRTIKEEELPDNIETFKQYKPAFEAEPVQWESKVGYESDEPGYIDEDDVGQYESGSDGELVVKKSGTVFYDPSNTTPRLCLGMVFQNVQQFRDALRSYGIHNRFDVKFKKNDTIRVRARCKQDGCPFIIVAGLDNRDGFFKIKEFNSNHKCSVVFKNHLANYKYLGKHFIKTLRVIPKLQLDQMRKLAKEQIKVDVALTTCSRARKWAMDEINGSVTKEFNALFDYARELRRIDPRANIDLMVERASPCHPINFRRFYVGFSALREGFLNCCRPIICLDGCFLKGVWKGEILAAVGRDGNDQIYPIAWAVVERENIETWGWFLSHLINDLGLDEGQGYTLMTDQQKGLKEEIKRLLPRVEHRVCARHLYANWKVKHGGGDLQVAFWACSKSSTETGYEQNMRRLEQLDGDGKKDLLRTHPKQWCKAFFSTKSTCDCVTNNHAEAFNSAIIGARSMSIISMFEEIRRYVMDRIVDKMKKCQSWTTEFCPKISKLIEKNMAAGSECHVRWNGGESYEIACKSDVLVVNLNRYTCTCRTWELTGIPCAHAITAILWKKLDISDYVARVYKTEVYKQLYSHLVPAVPGPDHWKKTKMPGIEPPVERRMPGRPRKKRIKSIGEAACGTKLTRGGIKITCQICRKQGHNRATCPDKDIQPESQEGTDTGNGTPAGAPSGSSSAPNPAEPSDAWYASLPYHMTMLYGKDELWELYKDTEATEKLHESFKETQTEEVLYTLYEPSNRPASQPEKAKTSRTSTKPKSSSQPSTSNSILGVRLKKISRNGKHPMFGCGVYVNTKTGLSILNPGTIGSTLLSLPNDRRKRKQTTDTDTETETNPMPPPQGFNKKKGKGESTSKDQNQGV